MSNPMTQGLDLSSLLSDPRTPPGMRAAAVAAMQGQQPQMPPTMPGAQPPPQQGAPMPPPPPDVTGPIRTGAGLAEMMRAPPASPPPMIPPQMAMARGGRVRGYAEGGEVDDMEGGAGLASMDPRFIGLIKQMMADSGKPTAEDRGLALAQAGFGMAASNSPHFGQALGEGASAGLGALQKLRQERALQAMKAAALGSSVQQHQDDLIQRREAARLRHEDQQASIQQRADAAAERAENQRLSTEERAAARAELNQYRQDMLDLRRGQGGATLPEGQGEEFLKQLPTSDQSVVKKVAAGEIDPRSLTQRDGYRNKIIAATAQYDPAYDQANVGMRFQLKKDFGSGKAGQNITSANTLIGHLDSLKESAEKLKNSKLPLWNKIANLTATQTGDPRVKDFNMNRQAVADELTRLFRGTGGTLTEIQEWQSNMDSAGSPEQLDTVITKALDLMRSRVSSLTDQYNRGFGTQKSVDEFLSPKSQKIIARLDKSVPIEAAAPGQPAPTPGMTAPAAPAVDVDALIMKYKKP